MDKCIKEKQKSFLRSGFVTSKTYKTPKVGIKEIAIKYYIPFSVSTVFYSRRGE